jgi:hypothetical protein
MKTPGNPAGAIRPRMHFIAFAAFIVLVIFACWAYVEFISDAPAIYAAGSYTSGRYYWRGTELTELPAPPHANAMPTVINVMGRTVYTAGIYGDISYGYRSLDHSSLCYWKNGKFIDIGQIDGYSIGLCINFE